MDIIFTQLAVVIGLAVLLALAVKVLRQPMIIGYILTGVLVGPAFLNVVRAGDSFEIFANLGVALLLFIVGIGLNPAMIKDVGKVSVITGIAQIVFTSVFGFAIGILLKFNLVTALYLAVAFTFSSTIIILRLLAEKEQQDTLYGRIAIGFLLVQDLVAMLIFVFLSSASNASGNFLFTLLWVLVKLAILGSTLYLIAKYLIPRIDRVIAEDRQLLFIFAIALCFSVAGLFARLGFSLELGALVAGVLLSTSPYHREIATRIQPLRDFFLVIFFIFLGSNLIFSDISIQFWPIIIFSVFILIGNPLIVLFIMTMLGHTRKTAFFAGLTVAQISEFSLIMIRIGESLGHIPNGLLSFATIVGLITIAGSSYLITYNQQLYEFFEPLLRMLTPYAKEREVLSGARGKRFRILIFGGHRLGGGIIDILKREKESFVVVDHDPRLVERLRNEGIDVIFGSADDIVLMDELNFSQLKIVLSTIPDPEINAFLLDYLKKRVPKVHFIPVAYHQRHAQSLYRRGASYVVMPPYLGRKFVIDLLKRNKYSEKKYSLERKKHLADLAYWVHSH